jgi:predicted hydrocarbon binding protein
MANSILDNLEYDESSGVITFKDVRYMVLRPDTVVDFQKAVEAELGDRVAEMMMAGGYTGGSRSSARYKEVFDYSDEEIVVGDSAFAAAYGSSEKGVCHMIRGVMAGMAAGIFGVDVHSEETHCRAKGDEWCRFVVWV